MLEYDTNLPQEFGHKRRRIGTGLMVIALALATAFLVYALVAGLPFISSHKI